MLCVKSKQFCEYLDEHVDVFVHYTIAVALSSKGPVPTSVKCSASPNGNCDKCDTCSVLTNAQNSVRNGMI